VNSFIGGVDDRLTQRDARQAGYVRGAPPQNRPLLYRAPANCLPLTPGNSALLVFASAQFRRDDVSVVRSEGSSKLCAA
jgi:hypothetical protein